MKNSITACPENISSGAKFIWDDVTKAIQQAEELGGVDSIQDYMDLMKGLRLEIEARIEAAAKNL